MIRLVLIILAVAIYLIFSIFTWAFLWIFERFNFKKGRKMGFRNVQAAFKLVTWLAGVKLNIEGFENIPKDKPVLYIGNHNSLFDTVITYSLCPGVTGFISKDGMKKVPLLNHWMSRNYCLFLDRKNVKEGMKIILKAIEYISKEEVSIFIFPEGTRSKDGHMIPFKEGSFKIATKTGCPIVPVALIGTADIFENHFPRIKGGTVTVKYGEPIDPKSLSKDELKFIGAYVQGKIEKMLPTEYSLVADGGEE